MENARDDIPVLDDLAPAQAQGSSKAVAAGAEGSADQPPANASASSVDVGSEKAQVSVIAASAGDADRQREELHASFNDRISYLCKLAALVIAVVAFATIALGQELPQFVLMGLCLSVALLAIAMLQDHSQRKR